VTDCSLFVQRYTIIAHVVLVNVVCYVAHCTERATRNE